MCEEKLDQILSLLKTIDKKLSTAKAASASVEIADDADLDGRYGDEEIKRMPSAKYWSGEDYTGRRMSETSVAFLEAFAKYKNACAWANEKEGNPDKAKYAGYDRKSAARARGWAQRLKGGWKALEPSEPSGDTWPVDGGSDIPF